MIIRTPKNRENPYAQINKQALQDPNLTWKAKGLLAYLLSLPDDWQVRPREIKKHANNGLTTVYTCLKELARHGYLTEKRIKQPDSNLWGEIEYTVHEIPSLVPSVISSVQVSEIPKTETSKNIFELQQFKRGERGNYDNPEAVETK